MRKGNVMTLILLFLFGVFAIFGMTGAKVGYYRMDPWYEQVGLGLDLTGGGYAVYQAEQEEMTAEDFEARFATTMSVLRDRLDDKGYTEATVVAQGSDRIRIEIPSKDENANDVFAMLGQPAVLEFKDVDGNARITGDMVESAVAMLLTDTGEPVVQLKFNSQGAATFGQMTAEVAGTSKPIHIVIDGITISSPIVENEPIYGGTAIISGGGTNRFTSEQAENLAVQIASGALPLKLNEIELRSISASLGENALSSSLFAGLIGVCVLFLFMMIYYRLPGILACIALLVYGFVILFILATIPTIQLTLPGIAGLILGIGMAVDANVIIFERFKEELATGKTLRASLNSGFSKALRTIIDSNVTTFIAAIVIAVFGIGAVKGFGYMLLISILVSMFTALVVTRALLRLSIALKIKNPKLYTIRKIAADSAVKGGE